MCQSYQKQIEYYRSQLTAINGPIDEASVHAPDTIVDQETVRYMIECLMKIADGGAHYTANLSHYRTIINYIAMSLSPFSRQSESMSTAIY